MPETSRILPAKAEATRLAVEIGGFSLGLWCESGMQVALDCEHQAFLCWPEANQACDLEWEVSWADDLSIPRAQPAFVSGGLWSAFEIAMGTSFYFSTSALGDRPYKAAWFDARFERGHVVLNRSSFVPGKAVFPLEYPIDELVMMHRLSLGEGLEVHALGLADQDGIGYLFLGHSGAGKSTTARLWMGRPGVRVLSDDRIILRQQGNQFWMYGTPWHGDAGVSSPGRALLSSIFLLEQAPANQVIPVSQSRAAAELFARSFLPHYLQGSIRFTLDFADRLTRAVPCSVFRFTPTQSAVEAIRHALG
jgi:hypothetical protein